MKKTNKILILELLEKDYLNNGVGLNTSEISEQLSMQRTNVSRILNELVEEGYAIKQDSKRPVVYVRSNLNFENNEKTIFEEVVGWDGRLKRQVHLAKAAIMYPNKSLYTLIVAPSGSGKSFLAKKMYEYAVYKEVLEKDAPYVKLNCLHYSSDLQKMNTRFKESLQKAENGFFYVDNCNLLDAESKNMLSSLLTDGYIEVDDKRRNANTIVVCSLYEAASVDEFSDNLRKKFSITIYLPRLNERPLIERFEIIKKFLEQESEKSNRSIRISSEVLVALLLYNCVNNVKQLRTDIQQACASAYVQDMENKSREINLLIMDFPPYVRSGLLDYKNRRNEVDQIVSGGSYYVIDSKKTSVHDIKDKSNSSIYGWIDEKSSELLERGFSENEINTIVSVGIESQFEKYKNIDSNKITNKEQLARIVEPKIIDIVDNFLKEASKKLNRYFNSSIFYGLCLHMHSLIETRRNSHNISIEQIMEFVNTNKEEYALATDFSSVIQKNFDMSLSIDEIVVIAMFLIERNTKISEDDKPSILVAMHGNRIARSISETIKAFSDMTVYYYDLSLSKNPIDAYDEIKQLVLSIPRENGILAIYDMGSLRDIFNMIEIELGVQIKSIEIPYTTMLLDCCRKVMLSNNVEEAHESITRYYQNILIIPEKPNQNKKKAIVSFCLTGEGGALQIKSYLEEQFNLNDVEVIPLRLDKQSDFMIRLNAISKDKEILCIIGTFNPNIFGIPFIPIENVFSSDKHDLASLLEGDDLNRQDFLNNIDAIYLHLFKELENIKEDNLKENLVQFILKIEKESEEEIDINEKIGLFVHLACSIDRLRAGMSTPHNSYRIEIVKKNKDLVELIKKNISFVEEEMNVNFNDDEIANIVCILKKSKKG